MIQEADHLSREGDMPRPRPPFVHCELTRHGRRVWYFRKGKAQRVRLPDDFGTPEFWSAYHAAIAGGAISPAQARAKSSSLRWLVERYRESSDWLKLSVATRRQRENIFKHILESAGDELFAQITRRDIAAGRDRRRETPFAGVNFIKTLRGLFRWAVEAGLLDTDPTEGVKRPAYQTEGYHVWTEEEVAQFEARWPLGTRERLALVIFLCTGLRRGDAARLGRQHLRDGVITIKTEKTGTPVYIPVLAELDEAIEATPASGLTFVATASGKPMTKESFGNWFRDACKAAGVPGSAHGLRKLGATRAANNGATVAQLEAIFGWSGGNMAAHYTREADRARLARDAITKLAKTEAGTSNPAPSSPVRASGQKSQ
jgi:integrase